MAQHIQGIQKSFYCTECQDEGKEGRAITMPLLGHWSVKAQAWVPYWDDPWDFKRMECTECGSSGRDVIKEQLLVYQPSSFSTGAFQWIPTEMLEDWDAALLETAGQDAVDRAWEIRKGPTTPTMNGQFN